MVRKWLIRLLAAVMIAIVALVFYGQSRRNAAPYLPVGPKNEELMRDSAGGVADTNR
jgi:hypothetical protein